MATILWQLRVLLHFPHRVVDQDFNIGQVSQNDNDILSIHPIPCPVPSLLPPDRGTVGEELVVEEEVGGVDGGEGDDEVGDLAAEEDEGVHVELVVDVLLELPQHPPHLLLRVVHHSTRRP